MRIICKMQILSLHGNINTLHAANICNHAARNILEKSYPFNLLSVYKYFNVNLITSLITTCKFFDFNEIFFKLCVKYVTDSIPKKLWNFLFGNFLFTFLFYSLECVCTLVHKKKVKCNSAFTFFLLAKVQYCMLYKTARFQNLKSPFYD